MLPGLLRADDGAVDRALAVVVEQPVFPFGRFGLLLGRQLPTFAETIRDELYGKAAAAIVAQWYRVCLIVQRMRV